MKSEVSATGPKIPTSGSRTAQGGLFDRSEISGRERRLSVGILRPAVGNRRVAERAAVCRLDLLVIGNIDKTQMTGPTR